jgi:hypothetical protein
VKYYIQKGNSDRETSPVEETLLRLGAQPVENQLEATHIIHMDVKREILLHCCCISEEYEDCINSPGKLDDVEMKSENSDATEATEQSASTYSVNFQWVYNCQSARKFLDEKLFPDK